MRKVLIGAIAVLVWVGTSAPTFCQGEVVLHHDSEAYMKKLVDALGDRFGPTGENLKEALNSGAKKAMYADNVGSHGATVVDDENNVIIIVDTKYHKSNVATMQILIHEQAHDDYDHEPNDEVTEQEAACNEAQAICAEICSFGYYSYWASEHPPAKKLPCQNLNAAKANYVAAWEKCNGTWFLGWPGGCNCLPWPDICD